MSMINERIQPSRPTLSNLVSELRLGNYFVDNSFQRRLVWAEKQKIHQSTYAGGGRPGVRKAHTPLCVEYVHASA